MKTEAKIQKIAGLLGYTELDLKYAGDGKKFTSNTPTKVNGKIYFTENGKSMFFKLYTGAWDFESAVFFRLKYELSKKNGSEPCKGCGGTGKVWQSNYGSSFQTSCGECGGYKISNNLI
jgi:hypothetical protein